MMKLLGFPLFALGVIVSACFAARAVSPAGSGPDGKVTGRDRVVAWGSVAGAPFALGVVMMVAGRLLLPRLFAQAARTKSPELFLAAMREYPRPDCFSYRDGSGQYVDVSSEEALRRVRALRFGRAAG